MQFGQFGELTRKMLTVVKTCFDVAYIIMNQPSYQNFVKDV